MWTRQARVAQSRRQSPNETSLLLNLGRRQNPSSPQLSLLRLKAIKKITPQITDEAEAPEKVPDEAAREQVTQESDEETQAPPPKPGKIVQKRVDNIFSDEWAYSNFYALIRK